ncbi:MAG TPA: hypothetical protein VN377_01940 [Candidatus Thermoplasmatota archaeon]|nr:hypothetical protein [Candidatus Thermoplasmatota archaeon]
MGKKYIKSLTLDNTLKVTVTAESYNWNWTARTFGKHTVKVVAYGLENETASKEIQVTKFLQSFDIFSSN